MKGIDPGFSGTFEIRVGPPAKTMWKFVLSAANLRAQYHGNVFSVPPKPAAVEESRTIVSEKNHWASVTDRSELAGHAFANGIPPAASRSQKWGVPGRVITIHR
jgi:hypothetical protein